jgi:hypothetical protein
MSPTDYSGIGSFTSELFDSYVQYKCLSREVQHIISHRDQYGTSIVVLLSTRKLSNQSSIVQVDKSRAIPLVVDTLQAVEDALVSEMNKIVAVVC